MLVLVSCFLAGLTLTALSDGLFFVLLGHHEAFEMLTVDHAAVDLELAEGVVDLVGGELLTPGHQGVAEPAKKLYFYLLEIVEKSNIGTV